MPSAPSASMSDPRKSNRILYLQYTNPGGYPPLLHSSQILARQGWKILFLGTRSLGSHNLVVSQHPNIECKQAGFYPPGWKQKLHYLWFALWSFFWAARRRPDWIYASDLWSSVPSLLINRILAVPLVYHEHDAPVSAHVPSAFLRFVLWARRKCARLAQLCIVPNAMRANLFQQETGASTVKVVWNCPSLDEVSPPKSGSDATLKLIYQGSIVPERLPLSVVQALKDVPYRVTLTVIGYETTGSAGYLTRLRQLAADLAIPDRLKILGTIPEREDLIRVCTTCHAGLALMPIENSDVNLAHMTGASNKPFDYLACGLAVLVSSLPDWQELYVKTGFGLDCDPADPSSIAAALRYFCEHRDELRAMGERGRQRVLSEWNYEAQFQEILALLARKSEVPLSVPPPTVSRT